MKLVLYNRRMTIHLLGKCLPSLKNFRPYTTTKVNINDLLLEMTSESTSNDDKPKKKTTNYPAKFISLKILGSGATGAPSNLLVFADKYRCLFNCGESTQRLANEHNFKLKQLEHIFLTSARWETIGGLPGMALVLQTGGQTELHLHGPPEIDELFKLTYRFLPLQRLNVQVHSSLQQKYFENHVIKIDYVPLYQEINQQQIQHQGKRKLSNRSTHKPNTCAITYICQPKARDSNFLIDRCKEIEISPDPFLEKLKDGKNLCLPSGHHIMASSANTPPHLAPVFIVVDCPTDQYLNSLVSNDVWKKYQHDTVSTEEKVPVHLIVHFTPEKILLDPKYVAWMESFPSKTEHLLMNDSCQSLGSEVVHRIQHKLNLIDSEIFPLLPDECERTTVTPSLTPTSNATICDSNLNNSGKDDDEGIENNNNNTTKLPTSMSLSKPQTLPTKLQTIKVPLRLGETFLLYDFQPLRGFNDMDYIGRKSKRARVSFESAEIHNFMQSHCSFSPKNLFCDNYSREFLIPLQPQHYRDEIMNMESFSEISAQLKLKYADLLKSRVNHHYSKYPSVLFLGTGSSIPNPPRNVSGILIQISERTRILLDCGEGTYLQLIRFYGREEGKKVLSETNVIYVSHLHADHHLGLIRLLKARREAFESLNIPFVPVTLIAPRQILHYLNSYNYIFEPISSHYNLFACGDLESVANISLNKIEAKQTLVDSLDLENLETIRVNHCPNAFGVTLKHKSGWKLTYSGDTMPCEDLVKLGQGSDLLIHEATMEDELVEEARKKMHSTVSEAIEIGRRMNAKFTILTHFSQRYVKIPKIDEELAPDVGIAFDNMLVNFLDLPKLPLMYPILFKCIFVSEYEYMEKKARQKKEKSQLNIL